LGVLCSVQLEPLKRYARVECLSPSLGFVQRPTTVQALGDAVQETSKRTLSVAPAGSVSVWSDQLVPFQNMARLLIEPPFLV
jgi:hypothetical protein